MIPCLGRRGFTGAGFTGAGGAASRAQASRGAGGAASRAQAAWGVDFRWSLRRFNERTGPAVVGSGELGECTRGVTRIAERRSSVAE